jgi:hypothetical protein
VFCGRFRFIRSMTQGLDARSSHSLGIKNDTKRPFEHSIFRKPSGWGCRVLRIRNPERAAPYLESLLLTSLWGHLRKTDTHNTPSHVSLARIYDCSYRKKPVQIWTSSDQSMWTPIKSAIQEESASDMGFAAGVAGAGVELPEQVAVWVA